MIKKQADGRWRVDVYVHGKRTRKFYKSKQLAEAFESQAEFKNNRARLGISDLTDKQYAIASEIFRIVPPTVDVLNIVRRYIAETAVETMPLELAIDHFLEAKRQQNLSERYLDDLRKKTNKLRDAFGAMSVSDINEGRVLAFLQTIKQTPVNVGNWIRDLRVFFVWCAERGYTVDNPAAHIERPQVRRKEPEILTVDQARKILEGTKGQDRAYAVLGMFAGIRSAEILRMSWGMISADCRTIKLAPEITKTGLGRVIEMELNVVPWLESVSRFADQLIFEGDETCLTNRLRMAAGLARWPQNALRHTFASYHLNAFQNPAKTALMLHSTENPKVLFRHYFKPGLKDEALKFWALKPS